MALPIVLKLGSLDLSEYCRLNPDDRFDPHGQPWLTPAFTETPYADGQPLLSETVGNREMQLPLFLNEPSKDLLHHLVREISLEGRRRPLSVEWQDASASKPTFFDVTFLRFEPDYNFPRGVHGYLAGTLHIWANGYGHTGTTRVCATAAGTGIFLSVPIASLAGDAPALLDTTITSGAVVPTLGRIVAVAPLTNPSYAALIPAASLVELQGGATLVGASGAQGSQYLALPVSPTGGASGVACKVPLQNPTIMGGDNRILAVVDSNIQGGVAINALDPYGNAMGGTAVASSLEAWSVVDLGVCRLPTVGFPTQPQISILAGGIWASGAAGPAVLGSPGLSINEVICLPDKNLSLILENLPGGTLLSRETPKTNGELEGTTDDFGNTWGLAANNSNSIIIATGAFLHVENHEYVTGAVSDKVPTAGTLEANAVTSLLSDSMVMSGQPYLASPGLGIEEVRLFKDVQASQYVQARFAATGFLSLESATGGSGDLGRVLASVKLASIGAGLTYKLALQVQGPKAFVTLSRADGGPVFAPGSLAQASIGIASDAGVAGGGHPALAMAFASVQGGKPLQRSPRLYGWQVTGIPSSNLSPFDSYRFDGVNADSYRVASSGVFAGQKLTSGQRGAIPKAAPSTTSVAIVCAPFDQGVANDKISAVVSVRERFFYAR